MIEVDRAMMEDYHIVLIQMMESAGRCLATLARDRFLDSAPTGKRVTILAGSGGNGGGALVAARRLHNWGAIVQVVQTKSGSEMSAVPAHQHEILKRMGLEIAVASVPPAGNREPDLIIDGLIGYSLNGAPSGLTGELIHWANARSVNLLALDSPSGIDTSSGTIFDPAISATATMTLALPKQGLRMPAVAAYVGELYLADISVPPSLYADILPDIEIGPIFSKGDIVRLR
jgi:NAD(P)H-hydrate epimerase